MTYGEAYKIVGCYAEPSTSDGQIRVSCEAISAALQTYPDLPIREAVNRMLVDGTFYHVPAEEKRIEHICTFKH